MADMMNKTINSIITAMIAVVLVGSAFIPTVIPIITGLEGQAAQFSSLLYVVVTMTIIGIIIGVIKMYTSHKDDGDDYE